ncbi:MAG: sensor histidine kinase [Ruminiclostridium sp.]
MKHKLINYFKSIKFRVWYVLLGFTIIILAFLYSSQVLLMPVIYEYMKTQECISTAFEIKNTWINGDMGALKSIVDESAVQKQMGILINFPSSVTGGLPLTYSNDATGSSASIDRRVRVSDELISQLKNSRTGMLFFPVEDDTKDSFMLATYVSDNDKILGYIFIYSYLEPTGTTTQILTNIFLTSAGLIIILSFIVSFFISERIAEPIVKISKSADKLITGEFNMNFSAHEFSEIRQLKSNLNMASYEISRTETLRKDLLANVSHDLRTPLTMIKAYAEMIRDLSGDNKEKREKHLQVIIDETDRLTLLVSDILNLSRLQSGIIEMNKQIINFSDNLHEIANRFSMLDETRIELDIEDNIYISADEKQLGQAVYNLIINAINYSGVDTVTVRLHTIKGGKVRFEVSDKGVGIAADQLPYIWERYYKVNRSENYKRTVKGTGLGLSIVKSVFEGHGFQYGVESEEGQGTTFWFECNSEKAVTDDNRI